MDENAVNNCGAEAEEKPAASFLDKLPKILPYLACAVAALSFIFTFLVGTDANYFYYYFGKAYSEIKPLESTHAYTMMQNTAVLNTVFAACALLCVSIFTGLTCYFAIRKFVYKKQVSLEKPAMFTYFAYILFAGFYYALNATDNTFDGVKVGYGAATIVGIVLTTAVFASYVAGKIIIERKRFSDRIQRTNFICSAAYVCIMCVLIGLVCSPCATLTFGGEEALEGQSFSGGFPKFAIFASVWEFRADNYVLKANNKLNYMFTASAVGFIVALLFAVICVILISKLISAPFGKGDNDLVFYLIATAVSLFYLLFSFLVASFVTDIIGINRAVIEEEVQITKTFSAEQSIFIGKAISVAALAVVLAVFVALKPIVIGSILKKINKRREEEKQSDDEAFLQVNDLKKYFVVGKDFFGRPTKYLKAVDGISFSLKKGKTLGIVGESGCGKSTMGRTLLRLYDGAEGEIKFKGQELSLLSNREFEAIRPDMQMIFQDPYASLSPRLTVGDIIGESALQHGIVDKAHYHEYVLDVMKMCGLQPHYYERYPHEFSGGQRQRICIARALALKPELVICDEPVSALDVSIQAQIINMLIELRESLGLTYIFISHDLSVVKHISDDVGVMYLGNLVEYGSKEAVFGDTLHPYTKALFSAVPVPNPHVKMNRIVLKGDIPSPVNPPKGCKFHTRCDKCMEICGKVAPEYKEVREGHFCACHLYNSAEDEARLLQRAEELERQAAIAAEQEANKPWNKLKAKVMELFKGKADKNCGDGNEEQNAG